MIDKNARSVNTFEENMKKAFTEMLVLYMLSKRDYYIGELSDAILQQSNNIIVINRPYAVILRLVEANPPYIREIKRRESKGARIRQYYSITKQGREYLNELLNSYRNYIDGINCIFSFGERQHEL